MCKQANNTFDMELSIITYFKMMRLIQVIAKLTLTKPDYNKVLHMEVPLNYKHPPENSKIGEINKNYSNEQ
jgi:hypothetical protein